MTRKLITTIGFIAATALGSTAYANQGHVTGDHKMPESPTNVHFDDDLMGHFQHLDKDDDGKVTRAEMAVHESLVERFKKKLENSGFDR